MMSTKHMVFAIQNPLVAILGKLREHTFSTLLSGHCAFVFFCNFGDLGCQKGLQNYGFLLFCQWPSKLDTVAKELPKGSRALPQSSKGCPKATKMEPQDQNDPPRTSKMEVKRTQRTVPGKNTT